MWFGDEEWMRDQRAKIEHAYYGVKQERQYAYVYRDFIIFDPRCLEPASRWHPDSVGAGEQRPLYVCVRVSTILIFITSRNTYVHTGLVRWTLYKLYIYGSVQYGSWRMVSIGHLQKTFKYNYTYTVCNVEIACTQQCTYTSVSSNFCQVMKSYFFLILVFFYRQSFVK